MITSHGEGLLLLVFCYVKFCYFWPFLSIKMCGTGEGRDLCLCSVHSVRRMAIIQFLTRQFTLNVSIFNPGELKGRVVNCSLRPGKGLCNQVASRRLID